jgi:hypothetical protein
MEACEPRDREPGSPWAFVLAGWLVASSELDPGPRTPGEAEVLERMPSGSRPTAPADPDRMCARELRLLPAIGPSRALAIVRARWEKGLSGGPEAWETLPGIGPETVRAVRRALDQGPP